VGCVCRQDLQGLKQRGDGDEYTKVVNGIARWAVLVDEICQDQSILHCIGYVENKCMLVLYIIDSY
jgi:hypothetical protein